ncbi:VacJ family lipoprotein [Rhodobacterales bacterium HKCCSP123]|nr:VacJ family lipoprotein [Rhodobacterales bacterium HKCCSP123]
MTACGPAALPPGDSIVDADEAQNRAVHRFNLSLDRALVGPASEGYGSAVPEPVRQGVGNFASNLAQPSYIVNNLLQVRLGQASQNTLRFLVNSTIGLGGLFDPATALGLDSEETDFGETLHVWGVPEGDFVMLPVFGPSTRRDTVGLVVDMALNPVRHAVPETYRPYVTGVGFLDRFGDRYDSRDIFESVLYESSDSYAQLRSLYLQNRRFELRGPGLSYDTAGAGDDVYADPYADPYSDPYTDPSADPYSDPYIDPYAP